MTISQIAPAAPPHVASPAYPRHVSDSRRLLTLHKPRIDSQQVQAPRQKIGRPMLIMEKLAQITAAQPHVRGDAPYLV
jgi:hypothetical protein